MLYCPGMARRFSSLDGTSGKAWSYVVPHCLKPNIKYFSRVGVNKFSRPRGFKQYRTSTKCEVENC